MNQKKGRNVRLFLVDGVSSGLTTAEIMNWTGHVLTGPRSSLPAFLKREELKRTGIYFLVGPDPNDPDAPRVYIGESDSVGKRLVLHSKDGTKDFWERTCVITSKDQNITKAHARSLEARLIHLADKAGKVNVANGQRPPPIALPEADESDMEFFVDQVLLILPILGFDFLRQPKVALESVAAPVYEDSPVFHLARKRDGVEVEARAREIDGKFVVFKDSTALAEWKSKANSHSYKKQRKELVKSESVAPAQTGLLRFTEDVDFGSPSAASAFVLGRPDNGRKSWKVNGGTYADWDAKRLSEAAGENDEDLT